MSAAGFYHCSVKGVGRTAGRSVVAAAAYRSGERLNDDITGTVADYRARGGVKETFILAPDHAPAWTHDREQLWNQAERAEARANGRLATEFELALPHELTDAHRKELLIDYLRPIVERHGVAVDVAIHEPGEGKDHRNIHAHVLITHRELGAEGFGEIANRRTITKKVKGQQKEIEIAGIAATISNVTSIRQGWEQATNRAYERAGLDIRVDHRSHAERGIGQEPTKHLGPKVIEMEARGEVTERGAANRDIAKRNAEQQKVAALEVEERKLTAEIIDLKAERAIREARDAAKGRYDRLNETHREVSRDQIPRRYDDLRSAEPPPEISRDFAANANRAGEPVAPIHDRDAAEADWTRKMEAAAIAKAEGRPEPSEARQEPGSGARAQDARQDVEDTRPLGRTAGDIRTAWTLTRHGEDLEEALAARGVSLAVVSAEEARQSERLAAFAKEVGNRAGALREGQIVAVNIYGDVHRFNHRTTGDPRPEIEARLTRLDRGSLLNVTDTKEVMQQAARAAWRDERFEEREKVRPASDIETTIAEALHSTKTGHEFAVALDKAGLTIARATDSDVKALAALREDAGLTAIVGHEEGEATDSRHFATLQAGEIGAVTRNGDVFRLNPFALDLDEAEQRLADTQTRLPSVVEARALNEISGENTAEFWADLHAWNREANASRNDALEGDRALRSTVDAAEHGVEQTLDAAEDAIDAGMHTAGSMLGRFAKSIENVLGGIFSFFGGGDAKLTPLQARLAAQANDELAEARAVIAEVQAKEAAQDEIIFAQDKQAQHEEMERETGYRERPGDREREREREWP
jgi:MobA/MobL family protein